MATQKQKNTALQLVQKHGKDGIYINSRTGHMHFKKGAALLGVKDGSEVEYFTKEELEGKKTEPSGKTAPAKQDGAGKGIPTEDWTVKDIQGFMKEQGIDYKSDDVKAELLEKVGAWVDGHTENQIT